MILLPTLRKDLLQQNKNKFLFLLYLKETYIYLWTNEKGLETGLFRCIKKVHIINEDCKF